MSTPALATAEIIQRGKAWYEQSIRSQLGHDQKGKILVIDVASGDYEVDADQLAADDLLRPRETGVGQGGPGLWVGLCVHGAGPGFARHAGSSGDRIELYARVAGPNGDA